MEALIPSLGLAALACLLAALIGGVLISKGPKDQPDGGRKDQARAMPTSGGIAVFVTVIPASFALFLFQPAWVSMPLIAAMAGGLYFFLMGLWDDLVSLPALPKLIAQIAIAIVVGFFGIRVEFFDMGKYFFEVGLILGIAGSAAWLVVITNAVNFMDGSDGLAMGSSAMIAAGLAVLAMLTGQYDIAAFAIVLLGGLLGLLFWNGPGKLFAGDTGALFVGFYLAALSLLFVARLQLTVWIAPLLFVGFLADVLLTLIWRFRNGRNLLQPHREHIYQLMIKAGTKQHITAWIYVWVAMHGVLIAGVSLAFPRGVAMIGFVLLIVVLFLISRRIRNSAINNGLLQP